MPEFQIIDEKRYPMPVFTVHNDLLPYYRWEHRVTLGRDGKRFVVFLDNLTQKIYAEDVTSGELELIEDDSLWKSILVYARDGGFLGVFLPLDKPK